MLPRGSRIITSDDVFQSILKNRRINEESDAERDALLDEYWGRRKEGGCRMQSMEELDALKRYNHLMSKRATPSKFVREYLSRPAEEASNGECALKFFTDAIGEDALFLLEAARVYGCQLVIATHSPLLLSIRGARIYDMDARPVTTTRWTDLPNVRLLHDFFREHEEDFDT